MLALSMDDAGTAKKFKESLKAPFPFIADPDGKVVKLFDVKAPVISIAKRYTFVVGEGRRILKVEAGQDAADPAGAILACPLRKPGAKDAGGP